MLLLLSRFSHVWLCETPWTAAYQASPSMGISKQEHWSGLPFPSPMHESGKWKWSHSVVSNSLRPHGLQPTRLLHPWDFLGNSTGVGCHCLLLDIHKCILLFLLKHNFFFFKIFSIFTKDSQIKTNCFPKSRFTKLGLVIYISAAQIMIDCTGSFKFVFLELLIKNLQIELLLSS